MAKAKRPKRVRLFPLVLLACTLIAVTIVVCNRYSGDIDYLEDLQYKTRLEQIALEARQSELEQEISIKDSDAYIMSTARELYGYLMPGEIRFQVTNIDDLYSEPEVSIIEVGK